MLEGHRVTIRFGIFAYTALAIACAFIGLAVIESVKTLVTSSGKDLYE